MPTEWKIPWINEIEDKTITKEGSMGLSGAGYSESNENRQADNRGVPAVNYKEIKVGTGDNAYRVDSQGLYLGSEQFATAPFRVTMAGALTATSAAISGTIDIGGDDATSFHVDSAGGIWSGASVANKATAPFRVSSAGALVATNITATGTINAEGGYLASGVYIDNANGLLCESGGLNVGVAGHIRGGQTDYLTGTGFFLGYSGAAYKFSVGNPAANYISWDGSDLVVNGYKQNTIAQFGGDGSDSALAVSSGTTTIDLAGAEIFVKNYSSISITGTGKVTFINPHNNGSYIILKSQGAVTITSSTVPCLDASGIGATSTNKPNFLMDTTAHFGGNGTNGSAPVSGPGADGTNGTGGVIISDYVNFYTTTIYQLIRKQIIIAPGSGGGNAGNSADGGDGSGTPGTAGTGSRGGGTLIIECGGAWNFTTALGISVAGAKGGNGTAGTNASGVGRAGGSGGGGGAAGMFLGLYNTLTANSGTVSNKGGDGGNGGDGSDGIGGKNDTTSGTYPGGVGGAGAGGGALNGAGGNGGSAGAGSNNGAVGTAGVAGDQGVGYTYPYYGGPGGIGGGGGAGNPTGVLILQNYYF